MGVRIHSFPDLQCSGPYFINKMISERVILPPEEAQKKANQRADRYMAETDAYKAKQFHDFYEDFVDYEVASTNLVFMACVIKDKAKGNQKIQNICQDVIDSKIKERQITETYFRMFSDDM